MALAPRALARGGMKDRRVDAERLAGDALDSPFLQVRGHAAARREDQVEAAVEVARIALGEACRAAGQARSGGEPRHRDEVRVAIRERRNAERLRGVERTPGDAVRISGLDQVGREAGDDARDRASPQRHAIAAAAGQRPRRQRRRVRARAGCARHCDRVAPARLRREPLVLGLQVPAHAATGRTPEHRRVDEVERFAHRAHCAEPRSRDGARGPSAASISSAMRALLHARSRAAAT